MTDRPPSADRPDPGTVGHPDCPSEPPPIRRDRRAQAVAGLVALVVVLLGGIVLLWQMTPSEAELLATGHQALAASNLPVAEETADALLQREPLSPASLLFAAEVAVRGGRLSDAMSLCDRIADDGSAEAVQARVLAGDTALQREKRLTVAEAQFRRAVHQDPGHVLATDRLSYILSLETRYWESGPFQLQMLQQGDVSLRRLYLLSLNHLAHTDRALAEEYYQADPADPGARLAVAEARLAEGQLAAAEEHLRAAIGAAPDWVEPRLKLGSLLLADERFAEFLAWHADLPPEADQHPGSWRLRGQFATARNEPAVAARCYGEAVQRDLCDQQAVYGFGQALVTLGQQAAAEPYLTRAVQLQHYANAVRDAYTDRDDLDPARVMRAAELAKELGLVWEALGWSALAHGASPLSSPKDRAAWRAARPSTGTGQWRSGDRLDKFVAESLQRSLEEFPLPSWSTTRAAHAGPLTGATELPSTEPPSTEPPLQFVDDARAAGVHFQYVNGANPQIVGLGRAYEFTGGGVAAVDYDQDGWPDLYFTQGATKPVCSRDDGSSVDQAVSAAESLKTDSERRGEPPPGTQGEHRDALFRNLSGQRFREIAGDARLDEDGYSQGVTAGDFDNDGFPDIYIGNFGTNRLFWNNGDGTFTDHSAAVAEETETWTTSCLLADVNGDSIPDLYAVNYLAPEEVLARVCRDESGVRASCLPVSFEAAADQLLLGTGSGRFENATVRSGVSVAGGKGLGLVAADLFQPAGRLGTGQLCLFIANDGVPNFLFCPAPEARAGEASWIEQALPRGLALNGDGRSEACMGIAVGDADGDQRLDLFVTNFTEETNTLYLQQEGGLFVDATRHSRLAEASFHLLGFGTQFLDIDSDGDLDLIVTNGHIDDYRATGVMYQMPAQVFRNTGHGQYAEAPATQLGDYFRQRFLGRGLARVDWNRDGREDVVISHLDAPVALLTNQTAGPAHWVAISLRGTTSSRDAVGATVTLTSGDRTLLRQLTAGDGYQAHNERRLLFGLGSSPQAGLLTHVDRLQVRWPSGRLDEFTDVPVDVELRLIEGSGTLREMR